jgi:hypothetical protein
MLLTTLLAAATPSAAQDTTVYVGALVDRDYVREDRVRFGLDLDLEALELLHVRIRQSWRHGPTGHSLTSWEMLSGRGYEGDGWWESRGRWEVGARVPVEVGLDGAELRVGGGLWALRLANGDMFEEYRDQVQISVDWTDSLRAGPAGELGLRGEAGRLGWEGLASLGILLPVTTSGGELRKELDATYEEYQASQLEAYGEELSHRDMVGGAVIMGLEGRATLGLFQTRLQLGAGRYGDSHYREVAGYPSDPDVVLGVDLSMGVLLGA